PVAAALTPRAARRAPGGGRLPSSSPAPRAGAPPPRQRGPGRPPLYPSSETSKPHEAAAITVPPAASQSVASLSDFRPWPATCRVVWPKKMREPRASRAPLPLQRERTVLRIRRGATRPYRGLAVFLIITMGSLLLAIPRFVYTWRSTAIPFPRIWTSRVPGLTTIGFIEGCSGLSSTASPWRANRFTVASPSSRAATISPGVAVS